MVNWANPENLLSVSWRKNNRTFPCILPVKKKEGRGIDFDFIQDVSVIQHALTTMVWNMHSSHHVGDHTLYVGEVVDIGFESVYIIYIFKGQRSNPGEADKLKAYSP